MSATEQLVADSLTQFTDRLPSHAVLAIGLPDASGKTRRNKIFLTLTGAQQAIRETARREKDGRRIRLVLVEIRPVSIVGEYDGGDHQ